MHAIENVTSSCRPLRSLCGIAMGFIKAGLLLGISMAARWGLGWNTFCYKCWTLALVVGDLSQRHSACQIILKSKGWTTGQELLRYVLFLPFCPKPLMEENGPGLYWCHIRNLFSWCFPEPLFSWYCCLRCQQDPSRSALVFLQAPKAEWWSSSGSHSGSESGTVSRGKADEPLLQRSFIFSLQPGCVSRAQDLGKSFHPPMFTSPFWLLFLFCLCCSKNQPGLRIWWLWGRSFLSYHCLHAVESLSPLQKSQRNTRGRQDNSLKPGFHDLESSSANMICSPSADVMPGTQSQPSRGKVSHSDSVHHWPFHFLFHTNAKGILYILSQSETKENQ